MNNLTIYDPAMCCSTGICGTDIDQQLVDFASDLDWLARLGAKVTRFNLSQEPAEFAANDMVTTVLEESGVEGLPVIIADGAVQSSGKYPSRQELAQIAGLTAEQVAMGDSIQIDDSACCGTRTEAPVQTGSGGCCGGDDVEEEATGGCC